MSEASWSNTSFRLRLPLGFFGILGGFFGVCPVGGPLGLFVAMTGSAIVESSTQYSVQVLKCN